MNLNLIAVFTCVKEKRRQEKLIKKDECVAKVKSKPEIEVQEALEKYTVSLRHCFFASEALVL